MRKKLTYALGNDGVQVHATRASTKRDYRCPGCDREVQVFWPGNGDPFFLHKGYSKDCSFTNNVVFESATHRIAKRGIIERINGGQPLTVARTCRTCDSDTFQWIDPRSRGLSAKEEVLLSLGFSADIGIYDQAQTLIAVFEIYHKHESTPQKRMAYNTLPWVELGATKVISALSPAGDGILRPIKDYFNAFACKFCGRTNDRRYYGGW